MLMETFVFWTSLQQPGLEQLHLTEDETGSSASGLVLGVEQATPFRFWYQVRTDSDWRVRECVFQVGEEKGRGMQWSTDGRGHWTDDSGAACSTLDGCLDLDISCTPFTNTLPIRRLTLTPGESAEILVAYLSVPDLSIRPVRQRYTCLSRTASGGVYRYEGGEKGVTFDLLVDEKALVVDYPGIWQRTAINSSREVVPGSSSVTLDGLLSSSPHPDLADTLHLFGQFVGDWEADWQGYQELSESNATGKGEIHFAWVLDGRAIQDVWIFPTRQDLRRGVPIDEWGSTFRYYDPNLDVWTIIFHSPVHSLTRHMIARPVGDEIWIEGPDPKGRPLRWIFSRITSRSFRWSNFVSEDGGQTWRLQEELEAHRVG
jgi:uncharacterized protein